MEFKEFSYFFDKNAGIGVITIPKGTYDEEEIKGMEEVLIFIP